MVRTFLAVTVVAGLCFSGCMVGPDYKKPDVPLPDEWGCELAIELADANAPLHKWWRTFEDPVLERIIDNTRAGNFDIQQALWRIEQARALRAAAAGELYPRLDALGSYSRIRLSDNGVFERPPGSGSTRFSLYSLGIGASWEVDVFGRIRRQVEAADASVGASVEDYRDLLVSLYAEAASNYVQLRALQLRLTYAVNNTRLQEETLKLTQVRYDAELAPQLDVYQARLNLANTRSLIPQLETQITFAKNRLGVLAGELPGSLDEDLAADSNIPDPNMFAGIPIPAEMVRQRPDIRAAERNLAAQTAGVGATEAQLYPLFSVSGFFGFEASQFTDVWKRGSRTYDISPGFQWLLFDGNRIRSLTEAQRAVAEQAYSNYRQTVLLALEEVENAIEAYGQEVLRKQYLAEAVESADRSVQLVLDLYRNGLTDFQNVLDTQRSLFEQQDNLASSEGGVVQNLIELYRALGGGWQRENELLESELVEGGDG